MKKAVNYRLDEELINAMRVRAEVEYRSVNSMVAEVMSKYCGMVRTPVDEQLVSRADSAVKPKPAEAKTVKDSYSIDGIPKLGE